MLMLICKLSEFENCSRATVSTVALMSSSPRMGEERERRSLRRVRRPSPPSSECSRREKRNKMNCSAHHSIRPTRAGGNGIFSLICLSFFRVYLPYFHFLLKYFLFPLLFLAILSFIRSRMLTMTLNEIIALIVTVHRAPERIEVQLIEK